jgi:hypothetical protein
MNSKRRMMILSGVLSLFLVLGFFAQVYAAETVTVKGELVDTYCYTLMGARGENHRQCAIDCAKAGAPAGLVQEGTEKLYVLLPNKAKAGLPKGLIDRVGTVVLITGKVYVCGGSNFLTVESFK